MTHRYSSDPYWLIAKFDSVAADGTPIKRGTKIFYYPRSKKALVGAAAEQASRDFNAAAADESLMSGGW